MKPRELDYLLQKKYGYSLWHFSLSFAKNFLSWRDYRAAKKKESGYWQLSWTEFWKKRKKELINIKKKNIEFLNEFLNKTHLDLEAWLIDKEIKITRQIKKRISSGDEDYIEKIFELTPFFETLNELIRKIDDKKLNIQNLRGAPSKRVNIIAHIWSNFIKDKGEPNLVETINLLKWFNGKFQNVDVASYKIFSAEINEITNEKLKKVIYKHKSQDTY